MPNNNTKLYTVYRILNTANGKSYIGMTVQNLKTRFREHKSKLNRGIHPSKEMINDFSLYGWGVFQINKISDGLNRKEAKSLEAQYIEQYRTIDNGYNFYGVGGEGVAKPVTWNGVDYPSINAAADALGIDFASMKSRLASGHICDTDMTREYKFIECTWNGVNYPSISAAAKAIGISTNAMHVRVSKGYTCDADMGHGARPVTWNETEYPSVKAAARANGVTSSTMSNRLKKGYTCDSDLKKNQYL